MPRKSISGFAEAGAAMAQQLDDNDLLNLFSAVGRVVSKWFLMKRPSLDRWQLVIDYLTSAMAFQPREQFRVLYLDKRNNLIADEVLRLGRVIWITEDSGFAPSVPMQARGASAALAAPVPIAPGADIFRVKVTVGFDIAR
jgi:hypothetical protein